MLEEARTTSGGGGEEREGRGRSARSPNRCPCCQLGTARAAGGARATGAAGGGFKASGTQGFKGPPGMGRASAGGGRSEEQAGLQKQQEPGACGRPVRRVEAQVAGKGILEVHLHLRMRKPLQAKRQARPGAG